VSDAPPEDGCWDATRRAEAGGAKPVVLVAAVALVDADGRVLLARRPEGKSMAGLWEFPGGKVQQGETPEAALVRELREELGIDTRESCLAPLSFASHDYEDFRRDDAAGGPGAGLGPPPAHRRLPPAPRRRALGRHDSRFLVSQRVTRLIRRIATVMGMPYLTMLQLCKLSP
jgi:8-oxo-dGTP pyrophosphatase MutT (NUDIX family)